MSLLLAHLALSNANIYSRYMHLGGKTHCFYYAALDTCTDAFASEVVIDLSLYPVIIKNVCHQVNASYFESARALAPGVQINFTVKGVKPQINSSSNFGVSIFAGSIKNLSLSWCTFNTTFAVQQSISSENKVDVSGIAPRVQQNFNLQMTLINLQASFKNITSYNIQYHVLGQSIDVDSLVLSDMLVYVLSGQSIVEQVKKVYYFGENTKIGHLWASNFTFQYVNFHKSGSVMCNGTTSLNDCLLKSRLSVNSPQTTAWLGCYDIILGNGSNPDFNGHVICFSCRAGLSQMGITVQSRFYNFSEKESFIYSLLNNETHAAAGIRQMKSVSEALSPYAVYLSKCRYIAKCSQSQINQIPSVSNCKDCFSGTDGPFCTCLSGYQGKLCDQCANGGILLGNKCWEKCLICPGQDCLQLAISSSQYQYKCTGECQPLYDKPSTGCFDCDANVLQCNKTVLKTLIGITSTCVQSVPNYKCVILQNREHCVECPVGMELVADENQRQLCYPKKDVGAFINVAFLYPVSQACFGVMARNEYVAFPDFIDLNNSQIDVNIHLNRTDFMDSATVGASLFGSNRKQFKNIIVKGSVWLNSSKTLYFGLLVGYQQTGSLGQDDLFISNISVNASFQSESAQVWVGSLIGRVNKRIAADSITAVVQISTVNSCGGIISAVFNLEEGDRVFSNITVQLSNITSSQESAGGVLGVALYATTTPKFSKIKVLNCIISGKGLVGGIIGSAMKDVPKCDEIRVENTQILASGSGAGGFFGQAPKLMLTSAVLSNVKVSARTYAGGIAGVFSAGEASIHSVTIGAVISDFGGSSRGACMFGYYTIINALDVSGLTCNCGDCNKQQDLL